MEITKKQIVEPRNIVREMKMQENINHRIDQAEESLFLWIKRQEVLN